MTRKYQRAPCVGNMKNVRVGWCFFGHENIVARAQQEGKANLGMVEYD